MSKIYEALRRHQKEVGELQSAAPNSSRIRIGRALGAARTTVSRLAREAGHGLVLHVVAATSGEGASTVSAEFAMLCARDAGSRVLLLDADRSHRTTAGRFGCNLSLIDDANQAVPFDSRLVTPVDEPALRVGLVHSEKSPPISRTAITALYEQCRSRFDLTIVDSPAVFSERYFELSPDSADGVVLVVQAEKNRPEIVRQAQSLIDSAGGRFIGAILNRRHTYIPDWLYRLL